jgi:hypothetical protein
MENIPKIVRERLRIAAVAADHPDADVLAAFAERALPKGERATVLNHLAHCGECREIVALALPAPESMETPVARVRSMRFTWPALRWGFAVAGIAVIAALAVVQLQHHGQSSSSITAYKATQPAVSEARSQAPPAAQELEAGKKKSVSAFLDRTTRDTEKIPARENGPRTIPAIGAQGTGGGGGLGRGMLPHGPRLANQANQFQQQNANALGANVAIPGPTPPMAKQQPSAQLVANAATPAVPQAQPSSAPNTEVQDLDLKTQAISDQPSNYGHGEEKVGRAKEPTDTVVHIEPEKVLAPQARADGNTLAYSLPATRWAITSAGGLQRSLDQGNSWQDVNVRATPAPAAASFEMAARSSLAKAKDSVEADKNENGPMVFRAIAANGMEVWAGGAAGQLYHSTDSGNHWTKVVPSAGGAVLTGDVVKLDFVDGQHGRVTTSTSEVWITGDDGLTWHKQ